MPPEKSGGILSPEERAKEENITLPKCFGNPFIYNPEEEPCLSCQMRHAWIIEACGKRVKRKNAQKKSTKSKSSTNGKKTESNTNAADS